MGGAGSEGGAGSDSFGRVAASTTTRVITVAISSGPHQDPGPRRGNPNLTLTLALTLALTLTRLLIEEREEEFHLEAETVRLGLSARRQGQGHLRGVWSVVRVG